MLTARAVAAQMERRRRTAVMLRKRIQNQLQRLLRM